VSIKTGDFRDADRSHKVSASVTLYDLPDGSTLLRLEDFQVTNVPDLHVILSPNANPESSSEVLEAGFIEVSKLKGNSGNQSYPLPAGNDMLTFNSVVIHCKSFRVVYAVVP
jgi:hypothetical protein